MMKKIVNIDLDEFEEWVEESTRHIPYNDEVDGFNDGLQAALRYLQYNYNESILTKEEKMLCSLIGRGYIVRYKDNRLFWSDTKPVKDEYDMWNFKDCKEFHSISLGMYPNCKFDFITWEDKEPWEVEVYD